MFVTFLVYITLDLLIRCRYSAYFQTTKTHAQMQDGFCAYTITTKISEADSYRLKSGKFGHQVNSDIHLQTVEIRMRLLLMSRLIRIFTVCLFNLFFIPIFKI